MANKNIKRQILTYIYEFSNQNGFSPSIREIAMKTGISISTTHYHLIELQRRGFITKSQASARTLQLTEQCTRSLQVKSSEKEIKSNLDVLVNLVTSAKSSMTDYINLVNYLSALQLAEPMDQTEWMEFLNKPYKKGAKEIS